MKLNQPDWGDNSHSVALSGELRRKGVSFYLILNAFWEPLIRAAEAGERQRGGRWIDTALDSPDDIVPWEEAPRVDGDAYHALRPLGGRHCIARRNVRKRCE